MHPAKARRGGKGDEEKDELTTSFAGTSPEVFLQKVVRSDIECIELVRGGGRGGEEEGDCGWKEEGD